ncbi:hypothetical protein [Granulicella sp. S156]|uniref:hypothetical protein n=1 Tax=Granulicella sp. S156 TaxID=1747224 RepID=UPI00131D1949|nr:hypothetical protein [Granulicella sp. S156]
MGKAFEATVKTATNEHSGNEDKNGPDYGRPSAAGGWSARNLSIVGAPFTTVSCRE